MTLAVLLIGGIAVGAVGGTTGAVGGATGACAFADAASQQARIRDANEGVFIFNSCSRRTSLEVEQKMVETTKGKTFNYTTVNRSNLRLDVLR